MRYLEENKKYLKQFYSSLYELLYDKEKKKSDQTAMAETPGSGIDQVLSETAINGEKYMLVQKSNQYYRLNSSYHPSHEAEIWANQFSMTSISSIIAMFGVGNGVIIEKLISRLKKEDYLFIYEPCKEIFEHAMQEYDLSKLLTNRNVILTIKGMNEFDFHNLLQCSVNITNLNSQIQCTHPCYEELFLEDYVEFWKEIRDILVHTRISINTEVKFGPRLLINDFKNLEYLKESYTLYDIAPEMRTELPAIIVAAGPSVKENIDLLKRAKGRAYIFAVDRILDYLLDNDVEPDFLVTVDPSKPVEYFSRREDLKFPLLTELASNWEIVERHKGDKIFFNCDYFFRKMYEESGKTPPHILTGASVATVAFSVCIQLGFDKIALVGQDLAYDGEFTHAGDVAEKPANCYDVMVEGVEGGMVRSRYDWKEFIIWYKDMIHLCPSIKVYDTKKKGGKIPGAEQMSLKDVLDKYGADADKHINSILNSESKAFTEERFSKALKYIQRGCSDLESIKKKAKSALGLCKKQMKAYSEGLEEDETTRVNTEKMIKINKFIESKAAYDLVDTFILTLTADDISTMYRLSQDEQADRLETYQKSLNMYQAILQGVDFILPKLREAVEKINN